MTDKDKPQSLVHEPALPSKSMLESGYFGRTAMEMGPNPDYLPPLPGPTVGLTVVPNGARVHELVVHTSDPRFGEVNSYRRVAVFLEEIAPDLQGALVELPTGRHVFVAVDHRVPDVVYGFRHRVTEGVYHGQLSELHEDPVRAIQAAKFLLYLEGPRTGAFAATLVTGFHRSRGDLCYAASFGADQKALREYVFSTFNQPTVHPL